MDRQGALRGEFTWVEGLAFCLAYVGVQLNSEVINSWGLYFYSPSGGTGRTIYVTVEMVKYIFILGTLWDAMACPAVGIWSERTHTRPGRLRIIPIRGRRRPFIFYGSIFMTFTAIAFWYPPVQGTSLLNFAYGAVLLCMHWSLFAITTIPLFALGPEVARSESARVKLGTWIAVGLVLGLAVANAMTGEFIRLLDAAKAGEATSAEGYRRAAMIYAFVSLILFQLPVWFVRERYDSGKSPEVHEPILRCFRDAARNKRFRVYAVAFFMFSAGFLAVQRVLPYWAELGLGGNEGTVTLLLFPFLLTTLASYAVIPALARRFHVKWMSIFAFVIILSGLPWMYLLGVLKMSSSLKLTLGGSLFAYCGLGQGIMYVMQTPLTGEIIDEDERVSGRRREAFYNSLTNLTLKAAMGISIVIATVSMDLWGNTTAHPQGVFLVGPIAGIFALLGMGAMFFYPAARKHGVDNSQEGKTAERA